MGKVSINVGEDATEKDLPETFPKILSLSRSLPSPKIGKVSINVGEDATEKTFLKRFRKFQACQNRYPPRLRDVGQGKTIALLPCTRSAVSQGTSNNVHVGRFSKTVCASTCFSKTFVLQVDAVLLGHDVRSE